MKKFLHHHLISLLRLSIVASLSFAARVEAQDNVWTSTTSGNWQDASWSLGVPATNQTIWVTNYGWKAVQIGADTAQNFPQSLTVDTIHVSSPTNTYNTLLLNFAGSATPLTVKALTVASNSAVRLNSSALQINGANGTGAMIGGLLEQNDSVVAGNQVNVGYVGPGVYNFNSGYFSVSQLWLGGSGNPGEFNQNSGTNGFGITHLDGGTYVLNDGYYGATIYFDGGGIFIQNGGVLSSDLTPFFGNYVLAGGLHQGSTIVPAVNGYTEGVAGMLQTAGRNSGLINIGSEGGGYYTMSNGVCIAPTMTVGFDGAYSQWNGSLEVSGPITINEGQVAAFDFLEGQFDLHGGQASSTGLSLQGFYTQTGGTNLIAGDILFGAVDCGLAISGGLLTANNLTVNAGWQGGVSLTGGTLILTNDLAVNGTSMPNWYGFACGGQLLVSNIWLGPAAIFACRDGVIKQSGTLTLTNASLYSGSNSVQFGPLRLATGGSTNSTLYLVSPTSILNFANSHNVAWSNEPRLIVEGWSGSLYGGGAQQVIFGNDSNALTTTQLAHIQFHNPAGLTNGMYPARILSNGEIVPSVGAALPASMALQPQPGGMQVTLQGEAGRTYSIETSTDLMHWTPWTNVVNTTGTMTVKDTAAGNYPARFYRARLMP